MVITQSAWANLGATSFKECTAHYLSSCNFKWR